MESSRNHSNLSRTRLAAALAAAARGWPVFPLYPFSKYPAVSDWENRATCDPDELAAWWSAAPYNTGIACGPAGLVVLDLDAAHGHTPPGEWADLGVTHGRDVLRTLADRAGQPDPIDTYTVLTPRVINGSFSPSLHCLQRSMTVCVRLVDSLLSEGVLQRDTTAMSFPD